ncbi:hypothetical protein CALCODRAFT_417179, partial [Calocera cornea HHB12733]
LPPARQSSAGALTGRGLLLIHGGQSPSDGSVFSDGWALDTTAPQWTWEARPVLAQLGARRDHSAVAVGDDGVLFLFGASLLSPA